MAEIPKLPEASPSDATEHQDVALERAAGWLLQHQESLATKKEAAKSSSASGIPLSYELDISQGLKATVELEQMAEADFDRHEVLDGHMQQEPSLKGMVPVSQILADHPSQRDFRLGSSQTNSFPANTHSTQPVLIKPLYRRALLLGVMAGIACSCAALAWLIFISR